MRSMASSSLEIAAIGFEGIWFARTGFEGIGDGSTFGSGAVLLGNSPTPLKSHKSSMSGKALRTLVINSKLGLFRPLNICEILERCTVTISAKAEADKP